MLLTSRQCLLLLMAVVCVELSYGNSWNLSCIGCDKTSKGAQDMTDRKLKKTKSKGETPYHSPVAWSPAMSPTQYYSAYYGTDPTDEPTDEPTDKPTDNPTIEPSASPVSGTLASGNIFNVSEKQDPSADTLESSTATLDISHHIGVHVSVAFSHSVSSLDIKNKVAKVTTKVIRSYTPFVVYMLDGTRRKLETTDLEYDPKFSTAEIAHNGSEVSWWTYNVAYEVTKMPEEQEEVNEIEDLAESAVESSIQSGLFQKLLTPIAPDVLGAAVPGHENDQDLEPPKVSRGQPADKDHETQRNRSVGIGLALLCAFVLLVSMLAFGVANRRRRRAAESAWTISMCEQKNRGQILRAEWSSVYQEEENDESMLSKGAFTLTPRDPPGMYMFGDWEHGTASRTEEVSARDGSFSIGNGSFT